MLRLNPYDGGAGARVDRFASSIFVKAKDRSSLVKHPI